MGYNIYGSDLEPRMIEYTQANYDWLCQNFTILPGISLRLDVGDATKTYWPHPFDIIATETYLGRPFSALPAPAILDEVMTDTNFILKKSLQNIAVHTRPGTRLCLAMPAWRTKEGFKHLPLLDSLTDMGYNRVSFVHSSNKDLIYHREDQIVARELVVLQKR
jgi:tRNA G10  N-methylase Trm11